MKNGLPSERRWMRDASVGIDGLAGDRLEHRGGLGPASRRDEVDPLDAAGPLELRQPRQRRVAAVELVRAQGHRQRRPVPCAGCGRGRRASRGSPGRPSGRPRRRSGRAGPRTAGAAGRSAPRTGGPAATRAGPARTTTRDRARGPGARGRGRTARRPSARRSGSSVADDLPEDLDDRAVRQALLADARAGAAQDEDAARPSAIVASSAASRLLPTPASPATRRCDGAPSAAAASAPRPASSSVRRPMVMGLTRRPAMAAIIGTGAWAGIVTGGANPQSVGWTVGTCGARRWRTARTWATSREAAPWRSTAGRRSRPRRIALGLGMQGRDVVVGQELRRVGVHRSIPSIVPAAWLAG